MRWFFRWLGRRDRMTLVWLGRIAGWLMYHVVRIRRVLAEEQIERCFPELERDRVQAIAEAACQHLCITVAEGGLMRQLATQPGPHVRPPWFTDDGFEHFEQAATKGKGVIAITAHLGNWDLFGFLYAWLGVPLNIVARDISNKAMHEEWTALRQSSGLKQISAHRRQGSLKEILAALKRNEVVALVIDQNMSTANGVFVDFFGRPACTLALAAILAKRTGAPVVPAFMTRLPDGSHHATIHAPLEWEETDDDIVHNTQRYTRIVEAEVRKHPEQWLWVHRRWKTQPAGAKITKL